MSKQSGKAKPCTCRSYNSGEGSTPEVVLPRPAFMPDGERLNGVPVDACIADVVLSLWYEGVQTLGSCCGHNKRPPSLVLGQGERDYDGIRALIARKDSRTWDLRQWQLVTVSKPQLDKENPSET